MYFLFSRISLWLLWKSITSQTEYDYRAKTYVSATTVVNNYNTESEMKSVPQVLYENGASYRVSSSCWTHLK